MTHTQTLAGQSPIGLGFQSSIMGFPGEDIFAAVDASQGTGGSQGLAHIHDLTFFVDGRIDATQPWQTINDSGTTAHAAMYRPIAMRTGITNNPVAPGWFQGPGPNHSGAYNGVASITASSAAICIPSTETAPTVGETIVFPYLASVFTATVSSTAGSCSGGATPRTLSAALPTGSTNAQAEWFAGSSPQNLATAITSGTCPTSITLSNSINPVPGFEANVAPFGLLQIDGEQFSYFARSNAGNTTPANTFYNIQCAQNGTTRAAHSVSATVVPLNAFKPSYPWPVTPTLNTGDTTPSGNAGYFPGWNVGNAAFAFPLASGAGGHGTGSWGPNSKIENLSFWAWPNEINGEAWDEVNHNAAIYMVQPSYATTFSNLYTLYLFYGIAIGAPWSRERQLFCGPAHGRWKPLGRGHHLRREPGQHPVGQPEYLLEFQRVLLGRDDRGRLAGRGHLLLLHRALQRPDGWLGRRDVARPLQEPVLRERGRGARCADADLGVGHAQLRDRRHAHGWRRRGLHRRGAAALDWRELQQRAGRRRRSTSAARTRRSM